MTASSRNHSAGSLPPLSLAISSNETTNIFRVGSSPSLEETDRVYTIGLHRTIPVAALNEHLSNNLTLDQVEVHLLHGNIEFCKINKFLEGDTSTLDFCVRIQRSPREGIQDFLALFSAKVHLLTADGGIAFEGEISWNVFSTDEISRGAVKMILTSFRRPTRGGNNCPIDIFVYIHPSSVESAAGTGAAGLALETETTWGRTYSNSCGFPWITADCVRTEAERNTCANSFSPLDLSLPNNVTTQAGGSAFDCNCGISSYTRDASTQTNTSSSSRLDPMSKTLNNMTYVPNRLRRVLKRLQPVELGRNYRFRNGPALSARELQLLGRIHRLRKLIAQRERARPK